MLSVALPVLLVCNYLVNPIGIQDPHPRLSWQLSAGEGRGTSQTAYEIKVSASPDGGADIWDSGKVASDASIQVAYAGPALASGTRAYWTVTAWDERGQAASSAAGAFWETGLLSRPEWTAQWIGAPWHGTGQTSSIAPYLRRSFRLAKGPVRARLYITALGLYEAYLNGHRIGDGHLTPGLTDLRKRVQYQAYDVTPLVAAGDNTIGAILGDGWYCGHVAEEGREVYGERPLLLAQLELTYADGTRQVVASDNSWQVSPGPILEDDILMGETYDARQELGSWQQASPGPGDWRPAMVSPDPKIEVSPSISEPVRVERDLAPSSPPRPVSGWGSDGFIFDFGQNLVGFVTLRIKAKAGTTVTLRYSEMLDDKGALYTDNLRSARATDHYTCRGDPEGEEWSPRFTYHGFRYAEVSGLPHGTKLEAGALTARVMHSDLAESGSFSCSNPLINQLQHNIQWSERGNYVEIPTDCPQRDERLGWTGDAQAFIRTGAWNRNVAPFFNKWQRDISDSQLASGGVPAVIPGVDLVPGDGGPAWADASVICPWTVYECYGDSEILRSHYDSLRRYMAYIATVSKDDIRLHPDLGKWGGFGDWLALDGSGKTDGGTPKDLIGTAFYAYDARILASVARVLGRAGDAAEYDALAARVKQAFQARYISPDGTVAGNTQTGYVLALYFDLAPEALRARMVDTLVADIRSRGGKLSTGFVGTPYILHVLAAEGRLGTAYALLEQQNWPSWLYAVTQGSTTIWERWDGWTKEKGFEDKGMNSFNHYAYGAVGDWLYEVVAGVSLDPKKPGYKHSLLQPRPGGDITWARGSHETPYGEISSDWKISGGVFTWSVTVPSNTSATATFPPEAGESVRESGLPVAGAKGVSAVRTEGGQLKCELAPGRYSFASPWTQTGAR